MTPPQRSGVFPQSVRTPFAVYIVSKSAHVPFTQPSSSSASASTVASIGAAGGAPSPTSDGASTPASPGPVTGASPIAAVDPHATRNAALARYLTGSRRARRSPWQRSRRSRQTPHDTERPSFQGIADPHRRIARTNRRLRRGRCPCTCRRRTSSSS